MTNISADHPIFLDFELSGYWYYNKKNIDSKIKLEDVELQQSINQTDLVVLMQTEWNLYRLGFGFVEEYISLIDGGKNDYNHEQLMEIKRIRSNKEWLLKIEEQAKKRGVSIDLMLKKAANHVIRNRKKK